MKLGILFAILMVLVPTAVSADELWVKNSGALHIQVWTDTGWEDVTVTGGINASVSEDIDAEVMDTFEKTGNAGMWVAGPGWEPEDGKLEIAAITISDPIWIVIEADNITAWNVIESVDGYCDWVDPEIRLVKSEDIPQTSFSAPYLPRNHDSGTSIAEVTGEPEPTPEPEPELEPTPEPEPIVYDWTGQEVWLYT